eukprot:scaffold5383_cov222-Amphora_coffeaeformis.AAC.28
MFPSSEAYSLFDAREMWHGQIGASPHQATQQALPWRDLQSNATACGQVIDTIGYLELRDLFRALLGDGPDSAIVEVFLSSVDYGVQIRKVCGRCSDFPSGTTTCLPNDYAYDALHSGLLIVPLDQDNQIKSGTSPVNILCHGTQSGNQNVPSNNWSRAAPGAESLFAVLVSSISGCYGIAPDYTGYAESSDYFRAYIVRKGYGTAVYPLLKQSEAMIAEETNCTSALADSMTVMGYSEGGYAAVAIADALYQEGKTIITVQAGGGPFRLSSVQISFLVRQVMDGTFTAARRYYVALLSSAYSDTTTDVLNYGQGQNMLNSTVRDEILDVVHSPAGQPGINALIPESDPLSIINDTVIDDFAAALQRGEADPCVTSAVEGETDKICRALQDNDLVDVLEATTYPVTICHSRDDTLVSFDNIPDILANPLLNLVALNGINHLSAAGECYFSSLLFFLNEANVRNVPVVDKTVPGGCSPSTPSPTETSSSVPSPDSGAVGRWGFASQGRSPTPTSLSSSYGREGCPRMILLAFLVAYYDVTRTPSISQQTTTTEKGAVAIRWILD